MSTARPMRPYEREMLMTGALVGALGPLELGELMLTSGASAAVVQGWLTENEDHIEVVADAEGIRYRPTQGGRARFGVRLDLWEDR